jgi:hypothetical protein
MAAKRIEHIPVAERCSGLLAERVSQRGKRVGTIMFGTLGMFVILTSVYVASLDIRATRGASITGDEPFYLMTTQSLFQDWDLDLRQQYERRSFASFFDHPDGLWLQSLPKGDGTLLSPHNPGLSVLLLPGFALAGLAGAQVQLLIIAALTFSLTYLLIVRQTGEAVWSWAATLAVALSATAFIYATEVYPEVPAALTLVVSLHLLQARPGRWRSLALAASLSAMVWLGVKYAPLAALVALWALWRMDPPVRSLFLAAGLISAAGFIWFHLRTFGALTPYSVGVVYAGDTTASILQEHLNVAERGHRLLGLLVDQRFGIGRWAPVLLVAAPALVLLWGRGGLARLVLALVFTQFLIATFVAITMMGWWFPGRTLMTVLPLLALPLSLLMARLPGWGRLGAGLLAACSLAITASLALAGQRREIVIAVDPFDLGSPFFQLPSIIFPNYTHWDLGTWVLTLVWLLVISAAALLIYREYSTPEAVPEAGPTAQTAPGGGN